MSPQNLPRSLLSQLWTIISKISLWPLEFDIGPIHVVLCSGPSSTWTAEPLWYVVAKGLHLYTSLAFSCFHVVRIFTSLANCRTIFHVLFLSIDLYFNTWNEVYFVLGWRGFKLKLKVHTKQFRLSKNSKQLWFGKEKTFVKFSYLTCFGLVIAL